MIYRADPVLKLRAFQMLSKRDLTALSDFRFQLAGFLRFSEYAARAAGITPKQYLLLLHICGTSGRDWVTVGELALRLHSSAHGTVGLVNRCIRSHLARKQRNAEDARRVEVYATARGRQIVHRIAARNRMELRSLREVFRVAHVS